MPRSSTNSHLAEDLHIELHRDGGPALHHQIEVWIRDGIRSGRLRHGTSLPPTRILATHLGVSRGVLVEAYQQLVAEGYLVSRSGGYTQIAAGPAPARGPAGVPVSTVDDSVRITFRYGRADVSAFPRAAWLRSVRTVLTEAPADRLGYPAGPGVPELRTALADYLNRVRGTAARAENVVLCNGYAQAVTLLVAHLARSGARRIAVEDPSSNDDVIPLARAAGLEVVGVPVGPDGVLVEALTGLRADAIVLTPSHQWPTGGVLSAESRAAVLRWAATNRSLVIEDDYDAEYRYDRAPVGAMQGLAPDLVAYGGTASKTLAPGLRLGWLVLPDRLVEDVSAAKIAADRGSPVIDQLTFADFLTRGEFDRHLRRMRPVYRRRRGALLAALRDRLPELAPAGAAAGLHLVAWLPSNLDEATVVRAAARHGVGVAGIGPYRIGQPPAVRGGLIFGYATLTERIIAEGIGLLADAIRSLR